MFSPGPIQIIIVVLVVSLLLLGRLIAHSKKKKESSAKVLSPLRIAIKSGTNYLHRMRNGCAIITLSDINT